MSTLPLRAPNNLSVNQLGQGPWEIKDLIAQETASYLLIFSGNPTTQYALTLPNYGSLPLQPGEYEFGYLIDWAAIINQEPNLGAKLERFVKLVEQATGLDESDLTKQTIEEHYASGWAT